eukprot:scaffold574_cov92-Isochrysis_galbana.AAC.1
MSAAAQPLRHRQVGSNVRRRDLERRSVGGGQKARELIPLGRRARLPRRRPVALAQPDVRLDAPRVELQGGGVGSARFGHPVRPAQHRSQIRIDLTRMTAGWALEHGWAGGQEGGGDGIERWGWGLTGAGANLARAGAGGGGAAGIDIPWRNVKPGLRRI